MFKVSTARKPGVEIHMTGTPNIFGQWLREKRVAKGYTLRKFAELVGVSPTDLSHVEQGAADPRTAERRTRQNNGRTS
ncbi:MAG: helix-turn-helix transcriptional regulator [Planctomycetota bacterium]